MPLLSLRPFGAASRILIGLATLALAAPLASANINPIYKEETNRGENPLHGFAFSGAGDLYFIGTSTAGSSLIAKPSGTGGLITLSGNNFGLRAPTVSPNGNVAVTRLSDTGAHEALAISAGPGAGEILTIRGESFGLQSAQANNNGRVLGVAKQSQGVDFGQRVVSVSPPSGGLPGSTITIFGDADVANVPLDQITGDGRGNVSFRPAAFNFDGSPRSTINDPIYAFRASSGSTSGGIALTVRGIDFSVARFVSNDTDGDSLAFIGESSTGQRKIIHRDLATRVTLLDVDVPAGASSLALHATRGIAFSTQDASGATNAIFAIDPVSALSSRLIAIGDALDGSTVSALVFDRSGLNDLGLLAFHATLADGSSGFYSVAIPAPAAAALLALVPLASRRRRR